jgi:hypothetical protein
MRSTSLIETFLEIQLCEAPYTNTVKRESASNQYFAGPALEVGITELRNLRIQLDSEFCAPARLWEANMKESAIDSLL